MKINISIGFDKVEIKKGKNERERNMRDLMRFKIKTKNKLKMQKQIKITEKAPQFMKGLPQGSVNVFGRLFYKFVGEFAFGLNGARGRMVEIDVEGEHMEPFLEALPTTPKKGALGKQGRDLFFQNLETYSWKWSTEAEVRQLFSSLELEHMPKFERVYAEDSQKKGIWRELTDEEIDKLYHSKDEAVERQAWEDLFNSFPSGDCNVKRILLAIDKVAGRCLPFHLKMTYFKDVQPELGMGILRLSFTYHTYLNEIVLGGIVCRQKEGRVKEGGKTRKRFEPKPPELSEEKKEELLKKKRACNESSMKLYGFMVYPDVD